MSSAVDQNNSHVAESLDLGFTTLKSRHVKGSMPAGREEWSHDFERISASYAHQADDEAGLIMTGAIAPDEKSSVSAGVARLANEVDAFQHRKLTTVVHQHGGKICMQILHPDFSGDTSEKQIFDFVNCAALARHAGYDGVEIVGGDECWGHEEIMAQMLEIIRRVRIAVGARFIVSYRLPLQELVEGDRPWADIVSLAKAVERVGVTFINAGGRWCEPPVSTCVDMLANLTKELDIPVVDS